MDKSNGFLNRKLLVRIQSSPVAILGRCKVGKIYGVSDRAISKRYKKIKSAPIKYTI